MKLLLIRRWFTPHCTIGTLTIEGQDGRWYTLEDCVRDSKIPGETAIPVGRYEVVVTVSARFKRRMPLLLNVPGFEGIRIHAGNTSADTEGCILVGMSKGAETIYRSKEAYLALFALIERASKEKVWITILERKGGEEQ